MTTAVTDQRSPRPATAGRHPGTVLGVLVARRTIRSGGLWGLAFGLFIILQTFAYTSQYPTSAARTELAHAYATNLGLNALLGRATAIGTVAGWAQWRFIGILTILGSLWGLLTATRLLRGDEEAGRFDLLLAGQTTRSRAVMQALAGLAAGLMVMFAAVFAGTLIAGQAGSAGLDLAQCLALSAALVSAPLMFLAIGAVASQLASTRSRAAALAGTLFGAAFALRMVADTTTRAQWLIWLTPLGWIEKSRPLTGHDLAPLLLALALTVAAAAASCLLAARRDLGAGVLPGADTAAPRLRLLGSPAGLAMRLTRGRIGGWLLAVAAFSALLGTTAGSATTDKSGSRGITQALGRLGGHGSAAADYLGLTFLVVALILTLIAATDIAAIRREEADGHLLVLLVRPVRRTSWLACRVTLSVLVLVSAGVIGGIATWAGTAAGHSTIALGTLVAAGLNIVPPALLLYGLGVLTYGLWPGATTGVVYGYLTWAFLVELAGGLINVSHWLLDTSVFYHMAPAPAASPDWTTAAILTGIGTAAAVLGGLLFQRRDLETA